MEKARIAAQRARNRIGRIRPPVSRVGIFWAAVGRRGILRHPEVLAGLSLALSLLWTPLPFGTVQSGARSLLAASLLITFALVAFESLTPFSKSSACLAALRGVGIPAIALAGVALFGVLQAQAWPTGLVELVSPGHLEIYRGSAAILEPSSSGLKAHLSVAPAVSLDTAFLWAAMAAALAIAAVAGSSRRWRRWIAAALIAGAFFQLLYGARRWLGGALTIWGVEVGGSANRLRGTFVNPNHLAEYLEISLAVLFAASWWAWRRAAREGRAERRLALLLVPPSAWALVFCGLAFTGSRAGLVAGAVGALAQLGLLVQQTPRRKGGVALASLALVAVGALAAVALQRGVGRLATASVYEVGWGARSQAAEATLDLWRKFPWTGTGLGTFYDVFPTVQPEGLAKTWVHAHNDPLEVLATVGLIGVAILALGLWRLLGRLSGVIKRGRRSEDRAAALAALGALVTLGVHECFDFGLTLPANALALVVVCGAAAGASLRAKIET